jgi:hypothetical protein
MLKTVSDFSLKVLIALPLLLTVAITLPLEAQTPPQRGETVEPVDTTTENPEGNQTDDPSAPENLRPLTQSDSVLSFQGGEKLMSEANEAINEGKYDVATSKLQQARKIFNQLSNFHLQLASSFQGIDVKIFEAQRGSALKSGQMRDEATYQLALVHRAQNQPELAVPLLIQVIRSQNPASELGKKSYQQLYELGFVDTPYSGSSSSAPPPSQPAPQNNPQ